MGIASNISSKIRSYFARDKQNVVAKLKKGDDYVRYTQPGVLGTGFQELSEQLTIDNDLMSRFADYEEMDDYAEIGSALDVFADEATVESSDHDASIWPTSEDPIVREILADLFYKRLRIQEDDWHVARNLAKYGNVYGEVLANENGVVGLNWLPTPTVRRAETKMGTLLGFVQDPRGTFNLTNEDLVKILNSNATPPEGTTVFQPYEIVHFRLRSKSMNAPYGYSVMEPARWIFRRLIMFEDSALIYKLTRSPARFLYQIETGNVPPQQAAAYVEQVRRKYKKKSLLQPGTGKLDLTNNSLGMNEDIWVAMRNGTPTVNVDVLSGPDYQVIDDLIYFRDKLFSTIKVPRSYLGYEPESSRAALANIDTRFAKSCMRIQKEIKNGIREVCRIHLAIIGIDPDKVKWDVHMKNPSNIFELAEIELINARADAAERLGEVMPKEWVMEKVWKFGKDDAAYMIDTKAREDRDTALRNAEVQSEIMREYPEAAMAAVDAGVTPGEDDSGEQVESIRRDLKKVRRLIESNTVLLKRTGKSAHILEDLKKDMHARRYERYQNRVERHAQRKTRRRSEVHEGLQGLGRGEGGEGS